MTPQEVKNWLVKETSARFKQKSTDFLYDVMLVNEVNETGEDLVLVRPASPYPLDIYVLPITVFCKHFDEYCGGD